MDDATRTPHSEAEPYVTKDGSTVRELVHPASVPGLGMSLAEAVVAAGEKTERHIHVSFDEIYYCLEGEGVLYIDDLPRSFSRDGCHLIPRGASHYLTATTRLRLLCACSPGYTHEDTLLTSS